ncbi:TolC family protein [Robertkochia aurantiaca]|uniref:TolC family protein n=1 Tax=Robertkochia aurantiaca TaxID=2873700 RepID=UPI001CD03699|nr:TolC family protein [Robertkochia sp. 3YJGBD-33]
MKRIILSATLLCSVFAGFSQEKKWTLQECVEYAVENNITVEQFELDLENAKIDRLDAIGNFVPTLNLSSTLSANTGLTADPTTNTFINQTITSISGNVNSGLTVFDGLRNVHQLNRAKMNEVASTYRLEGMKDDIRLNVANNYLQVLSNRERLNVLKAQLEVSRQDLLRTQELVENGVLPEGDLLEIKATVANQEQQIVAAENDVILSRIALAQLLQITDYENFDVVDEGYVIPDSDILAYTPDQIFAKSLEVINNVKLSEANVDLAEQDLKIARGARWPTLDAFLNYQTRFADNSPFPFVDQLWVFDGISYGLRLNIPILSNFRVSNNIKRNKINLERTQLQFEQDKLDLEANVNQAYADVRGSLKAYEAAETAVEARRLSYAYAKDRYDVGLMNSFDFSQAQARLDNAEAELIRTKYNYIFRLKVLEFYFGIPLGEI